MASGSRSKKRRVWKLLFFVVVPCLLLAVCATAVVALGLLVSQPEYWKHNQLMLASKTPQQLKQTADNLEARFADWLGRPQPTGLAQSSPGAANAFTLAPGEVRQLTITMQEANAWLATNGVSWLNHQGIHVGDRLTDPMIAVEDGQFVAAFKLQTEHLSQIISLVLDATLQDDGMIWVQMDATKGGNLSVPTQAIDQQIKSFAEDLDKQQKQLIDGLVDGIAIDPAQWIDVAAANPNLKLVELSFDPDSITVAIKAEPPRPRQ